VGFALFLQIGGVPGSGDCCHDRYPFRFAVAACNEPLATIVAKLQRGVYNIKGPENSAIVGDANR
jgi:hypothetical protein